jgi:hypothetical protein
MADSKTHRPGGLLDQYNLLGAIIDASWATRLDHKVARHIIDRYYPKHGNGRASLRYLERATGASRPNVIASVRRLAEQGAIVLVRQGQGTRPSEFSLNFEFPSSGIADDTTSTNEPSGTAGDTSGGIAHDTSSASSGIADDTESYLQNPAYKAEIQIDRDDTCPPTAPPLAGGLAATAAGGTAVDERADTPAAVWPSFEALWRAYSHAKGKKEAKAAWNALPAEVDKAVVLEAAKAWQASWAAQGKPDAPRYTLARWLKDERYDESPPTGYQAKAKPAKAKATTPAKPAKRQPAAPITARVTASEVVKVEGLSELRFTATDEAGVEHEHVITLEHPDMETQFEGQRQLAKLVHAAGLEQIQDSSELHDRTIVIAEDGFAEPDTRPDDEPLLPVKPEPEPVVAPPPPSKPWTEADEARVRAKVAAMPSAPRDDYGTKAWERRYQQRQECAAGIREWDAVHPELFVDKPSGSVREITVEQYEAHAGVPFDHDDDGTWPEWMNAEYEEDDAA